MATFEDELNEGLEEEADEAEEEEGAVEVAAPPPRAAKKSAARRGAGKPKPAPRGMAAQPGLPSPSTMATGEQWPTDGEQLWDAIVEATNAGSLVSYKAASPADWKIDVTRTGSGPMPSEPVKMSSISGRAVAGSEQRTPGEALYDYIAELYHPVAPGAAKYDLAFTVRGGRTFKRGYIELPNPTELAQQRARIAQHAQQMAIGAIGQPGVVIPGRPAYPQAGFGAVPVGGGYPPPQQQPPYYPPQSQPQDFGARDSVDAMRREMAALAARIDERERMSADATARAPVGVGFAGYPQQQPPAAMPAEDLDQRIARVMLTTLGALGIGPAARPAVQTPVGVAAPPPPVPGIGSVVDQARTHMSGLKEIMGIMKEFRELDQGFRPPEVEEEPEREENPIPTVPAIIEEASPFRVRPVPFSESPLNGGKAIMWVERNDGEETTTWLTRMGAANPDATMNVLQIGMKMLDQMSIGQLLKQWLERGGPMAQAAAAVSAPAAVSNGLGSAPSDGNGGYPPA